MNVKIYDKLYTSNCKYNTDTGILRFKCENDVDYYLFGEEINENDVNNNYCSFIVIYLSKGRFNKNCRKLHKGKTIQYIRLNKEIKNAINNLYINKELDFIYYDTIELDDIDSGYKTQVHIYKLEKEPNESNL